jgi:NAD(P)-dependent dehydrogenase (short-subunit alcohol dehydrogenase family)
MTMSVEGQRVVIIGAAGGIGKATVEAFVSAKAAVTAVGRTLESVEQLAERFKVKPMAVNFLDNDSVEAFFKSNDPFDHVVIAAASTIAGPVAGLSLGDAKSAMESKFWGAYRVARAARVNSGGSITFVSGMLSKRPSPTSVLQGAINAALEALARGLALERAPIRVNAVSPGIIDTPLHNRISSEARAAMFSKMASNLPVRRVGHAEDVAQAIVFAASNSFVTGSTIAVDGGGTIM